MLTVMLVRHGETEWNRLHHVQGGGSDVPLNEEGRRQAKALGLWLKKEPLRAIYSSPLVRARDTAQAIAVHHGLEVELEPDFREMEMGELEGAAVSSIGSLLDALVTTRGEGGEDTGEASPLFGRIYYAGGESLAGLQQRTWVALQHIAGRHSEGTIVIVSHYFVILTIVCAVLDLSVEHIGRFRAGGSSISTIVFDGEVPRLTLFGDTCHLKR